MNINNYPSQSFCKASAEELEVIKYFYGLHMDTQSLLAVQKHFYTLEMREPSSDELAFIDSFYRFNRENAGSVRINSVRSADKNVGDAFDDIVKKLESLEAARRSSYSYNELLATAQRTLDYFKNTTNHKLPVVYCGDAPLTCAMNDVRAQNHVSVSCTDFKFTVSGKLPSVPDENAYNICDSDHFIFLCKKEETDTSDSLENAVFNLKNTLGHTVVIKKVIMTDETGIVGAVLKSSNGAFLNFLMLCSLPYSFSPRNLAAGLPSECAIAVVSELSLSTVINSSERFGLKAIPFGRPTKVKRLTLTNGNGAPISIASDFIRNIAASTLSGADIPQIENDKYPENAETLCVGEERENYVLHAKGDKLISAVALERGGFIGAAKTLLYSVSKLVSCGVDPESIVSTVEINANGRSTGEILSYITGIYRVRAELSLASCNDCVNDHDGNALCALVAAKSYDLPEIPHTLTDKSSNIYLLYPRMSDDGLPKFSDVRRLFAYVSSLIKSKKILSIRALGVKGLTECIRDMGYTTANINPEGEKLAVCGSFVVESAERIDGLMLFSKNQ